ncbi:MAG: tellurite resistance TerB family protein [Thermodesulfobacteriota bacterium]
MFNPEKLLKGLISSGIGRRGDSLVPGGAALGLLGVAMEAVSHYMDRAQNQPSAPPPTYGIPTGDFRRPGQTPVAPPPPPGPSRQPPPPPGVSMFSGGAPEPKNEAVLLIRAMIAAANADGLIDDREQAAIFARLKTADLSDEEQAFIRQEMAVPMDPKRIAAGVTSLETARMVYTVSLVAVEVDTDAERNYLRTLAGLLSLDPAAVNEIHRQLGLGPL